MSIFILPIVSNLDSFFRIIKRSLEISIYTLFNLVDEKIISFGIDMNNLNIESLIKIQEIWWILFCIINILLIIVFSNRSFISLNDLKKKNFIEEIKKNKIYFIVFFFVFMATLSELFYYADYGTYYGVNFSCWNMDLKSKLNQLTLIKKIISSFYFLIMLAIFGLDSSKSTFIKLIIWYWLWYFVRSMVYCSGLTCDITTILFIMHLASLETINSELKIFSLFPKNTFSMEGSKSRENNS